MLQDKYDFKEVEERIGKFWEKERVYAFDPSSKRKIYAIDTPPPTVSGFIHIGHIFSYSQADFVARYKRMQGFNVFYPFGFDNNGLPTEILVEKNHKTTAEHLGREKFIALVDTETKKYEKIYREVWQKVGISVDWSRTYSTIGKDAQRVSQLSFLRLSKAGRTYRKETPVTWCPADKTAVSQMELKDKTLKSKFVDIRFAEGIVIATTRPELLPACVAIFVNPDNKKTKKLIGRTLKVPLSGQEVEILADKRVDPEKGTGIVMCCTFGDLTDVDWYRAYNLPLRIIIDEHGKMTQGDYKGLKIKEARTKIIADLKEKGYVVGEKEIEHTVNVHERCDTEIEFLVKMQWYIRYLDLKDKLVELGRQLSWHPEFMRIRYENWVNGLQWDWTVSRQRYYGVPFPLWYCKKCGEVKFAEKKDLPVNPMEDKPKGKCGKCGSEQFVPEIDVMDTWATSSNTPLLNAKWDGDTYDKRLYPMSLRPQAHDIISFWLFTSVVKGYLHTGKLPWADVLISGHGLDQQGRPMHKSAGNIIEPDAIIKKNGADPLRYWASLSRLGEDASFQEKDVMSGSKLAVKLWNVAKFVEKNGIDTRQSRSNIIDRWQLSKLMVLIKEVTRRFDEYDYAGANRLASEFFWAFTDNYLEFIKYRIYKGDKSANYALSTVFLSLLKMFAPFMPYVTDEIYQQLYKKHDGAKSIHVSEWPKFEGKLYDQEDLNTGDKISKTIVAIRQWKHNQKMALNAELQKVTVEGLSEGFDDIAGAMNVKEVVKGNGGIEVPETEIKLSIMPQDDVNELSSSK